MKPLDKRTQKSVDHELHLLKDEINHQLRGKLIPIIEPLARVITLFDIELSLLSLGNKKFASRH